MVTFFFGRNIRHIFSSSPKNGFKKYHAASYIWSWQILSATLTTLGDVILNMPQQSTHSNYHPLGIYTERGITENKD